MHNLKKLKILYKVRLFFLFLLDIGIDIRRIKYIKNIFKYLIHLNKFKKMGGIVNNKYVILSNFNDEAGNAKGHYFHQDLLVATFIFNENPENHVDVGSRIDGFVAHVASFRKIKIFDIRDIEIKSHNNIIFERFDILNLPLNINDITDSLSCLHVIEHIGLGRYGDNIDPNGHIIAFKNLIRLLKKGGKLYISFPISNSTIIQFNAHRIFKTTEILNWMKGLNCKIVRFDYVDDNGNLNLNSTIDQSKVTINYGCGIYTIQKFN